MEHDELEDVIDSVGLSAFLDRVADICHAKAEHVQSTWQDVYLAKLWERAGNKISKLAIDDTINALP